MRVEIKKPSIWVDFKDIPVGNMLQFIGALSPKSVLLMLAESMWPCILRGPQIT